MAADDGLDIPDFLARGALNQETLKAAEAGVPFVMTQEMKRRLRLCGYSHDSIANMTPAEAHAILGPLSS